MQFHLDTGSGPVAVGQDYATTVYTDSHPRVYFGFQYREVHNLPKILRSGTKVPVQMKNAPSHWLRNKDIYLNIGKAYVKWLSVWIIRTLQHSSHFFTLKKLIEKKSMCTSDNDVEDSKTTEGGIEGLTRVAGVEEGGCVAKSQGGVPVQVPL
ncbi:hypothetical protein J6590_026803 [Homalodisca vitripennis]|nr:hypothetical protein J6590_026803 [Homalodisca vitripennis]